MRSVVVELVSRRTLPGIPLFCCIHLLVVCSIPLDPFGGGGTLVYWTTMFMLIEPKLKKQL